MLPIIIPLFYISEYFIFSIIIAKGSSVQYISKYDELYCIKVEYLPNYAYHACMITIFLFSLKKAIQEG